MSVRLTKQMAEKIGRQAHFDGAQSGTFLHKLQRRNGRRIEVHPTAGGGRPGRPFPAIVDENNRPIGFGAAALEWAVRFPGWELVFA